MIGFARLVTDYVTFGYLTDVYVLTAHQGKGLARWMMECLDEVLAAWPHLRRCVLFTGTKGAARLYRETIGALDLSETSTGKLIVMERPGRTVTVLDGIGKKEGEGGVKEKE
jgi:GNAT superfamily N-acetyltransferase